MAPPVRTPRSTWIDAGLGALAAGGPDAVRIEPLARQLGVTRGGFYGLFESRRAFLDALLDTWEERSTGEVLARVESEGGDARARVRLAGILTFRRELLAVDLAVRDWARRDKAVARRLRRVDDRRMDYLRAQIGGLAEGGADLEARAQGGGPVAGADLEARVLLAFTLAIGRHFVSGRTDPAVLEQALDVILR